MTTENKHKKQLIHKTIHVQKIMIGIINPLIAIIYPSFHCYENPTASMIYGFQAAAIPLLGTDVQKYDELKLTAKSFISSCLISV